MNVEFVLSKLDGIEQTCYAAIEMLFDFNEEYPEHPVDLGFELNVLHFAKKLRESIENGDSEERVQQHHQSLMDMISMEEIIYRERREYLTSVGFHVEQDTSSFRVYIRNRKERRVFVSFFIFFSLSFLLTFLMWQLW